MHRRVAGLLLLLLCSGTLSARPLPTSRRGDSPPYRISHVTAQLFYTDRGTFSDDLLARPNLKLWNTIIGEGEGGGASNATLVVIEITGKAGDYATGRTVEIAVSNGHKEILRRKLYPGVLNAQGHGYVAAWLYDTGCEPLRISTAVLGQADPSRTVARIPFHCGE